MDEVLVPLMVGNYDEALGSEISDFLTRFDDGVSISTVP